MFVRGEFCRDARVGEREAKVEGAGGPVRRSPAKEELTRAGSGPLPKCKGYEAASESKMRDKTAKWG